MQSDYYTVFTIDPSVPPDAIADALEVAVTAVRGAQGESAVLLEAGHEFDPELRQVRIATEAPAGRELARVFHGLAARSLGAAAIGVTSVREAR